MFLDTSLQVGRLLNLNHTFIVLVPKKHGALENGDFMPISYWNITYKAIAKISVAQ